MRLPMYQPNIDTPLKRIEGAVIIIAPGEGSDFSLDFTMEYEEALSNFVSSESMAVGETFFMGRNSEKGPFMVVVEMLCE